MVGLTSAFHTAGMGAESYINHPNFGLLYQLCDLDGTTQLFATLYAQRLFFRVSFEGPGTSFEAVTRNEARSLFEARVRVVRRTLPPAEVHKLETIYRQTFL